MIVAIVGSRNYSDSPAVWRYVKALPRDTVLVSGGSGVVDMAVEDAARDFGMDLRVFPAKWNLYGKAAGPMRNADIVALADRVVVFWDGKSRGSANVIKLTHEAKKPIEIILTQDQ